MTPEKIINFIGSKEHNEMIEDLGNFLGIDWENEKMTSIINLTDDLVRNRKFDEELKPTIKKWLGFLEEEKIAALENYFREKYQSFLENLWQEAEKERREKTEEETEEKVEELTFEEKEKRYLELMKEIYGFEPKLKTQEKETLLEAEEKKIITLTPSEETKVIEPPKENEPSNLTISWEKIEEKTEPKLPEGTIIIKKKEEKEIEKGEGLLDLSNL